MRFVTTLAWSSLAIAIAIAATQNLQHVSVRWLWLQSVPFSVGLWMVAALLAGILAANLGLSLLQWGRHR